MEKDRSSKIIAIVALFVAVIGLSLGFSAFSQTLTISPQADVDVDESKFNIDFSTDKDSIVQDQQVTPTYGGTGATGESATLSETTISNIKAHFNDDNQTVTYSFYVYNDSPYTAYLTGVTFSKPSPECTEKEGADVDDNLLNAACSKIQTTVNVHSGAYTTTDNGITGKSLAPNTGAEITVVITSNTGATVVDGDYDVNIGSITLNYSTKNPAGA